MFSDNGGDRDSTRTWTIILATAAVAFAPLYTLKDLAEAQMIVVGVRRALWGKGQTVVRARAS